LLVDESASLGASEDLWPKEEAKGFGASEDFSVVSLDDPPFVNFDKDVCEGGREEL
jgi:hypothetical protein